MKCKIFPAMLAIICCLLAGCSIGPVVTNPGDPVLFFSDIVSGPKVGNTDTSLGQVGGQDGAIVTIWGKNLGAAQGSSTVTCNGAAAAVYLWGNATAPADLYTYHGMQMVSFQVSHLAADGAGSITATVNGITTNALPFTVRSGHIYFVKTTGNDITGDGSWTNPWATLNKAANGLTLAAGDLVYACDGVVQEGANGFVVRGPDGTPENPISIVAYPGATVICRATGSRGGITNWNAATDCWNFSCLHVETVDTGIYIFRRARIVGCEITGPAANGVGGAVAGSSPQADGMKCLGNYIHDFGHDGTSKLHHVFYISNRTGTTYEAFELGWNYLRDNKANHALHVYDEGAAGDWSGVMRIHDNVVVNQRGCGFDISSGGAVDPCFSMEVQVYNNLLINCGLGPIFSDGTLHACAIYIGGANNRAQIKLYNNTIYAYGDETAVPGGAVNVGALEIGPTFGGTWELVNNIFFDTKNVRYLQGTPAPPDWDSDALTDDPQLAGAPVNLHLSAGSPCIGAGADTTPVVRRDLDGVPRVAGSMDIGAYEYVE